MKELTVLEDAERGQTVGVYFSAKILEAGKTYSARSQVPFSRVVESALREHLTAHGALPSQDDAEWQVICAGLKEVCTKDELREILDRRTTPEAKKEAIR